MAISRDFPCEQSSVSREIETQEFRRAMSQEGVLRNHTIGTHPSPRFLRAMTPRFECSVRLPVSFPRRHFRRAMSRERFCKFGDWLLFLVLLFSKWLSANTRSESGIGVCWPQSAVFEWPSAMTSSASRRCMTWRRTPGSFKWPSAITSSSSGTFGAHYDRLPFQMAISHDHLCKGHAQTVMDRNL